MLESGLIKREILLEYFRSFYWAARAEENEIFKILICGRISFYLSFIKFPGKQPTNIIEKNINLERNVV